MREKSGITLVSLVITIIILIILAGISINTLVGDNGIITKAQQAKENMILAQGDEEKQLNELYSQLNSIGSGGTDTGDSQAIEKLLNFKKVIATAITNEGVATQETDAAEVMASNIGKILQERTKDATATAEDIAEGKTAWINGKKLTGTYKNTGYQRRETTEIPEGITDLRMVFVCTSNNSNQTPSISGDIIESISQLPNDYYGLAGFYTVGIYEFTVRTNGEKGKITIDYLGGRDSCKNFYYIYY
ncbi:MAG: hypothetical protein ACLTEH_02730 [Clostridia bacterium]